MDTILKISFAIFVCAAVFYIVVLQRSRAQALARLSEIKREKNGLELQLAHAGGDIHRANQVISKLRWEAQAFTADAETAGAVIKEGHCAIAFFDDNQEEPPVRRYYTGTTDIHCYPRVSVDITKAWRYNTEQEARTGISKVSPGLMDHEWQYKSFVFTAKFVSKS